MHATVKDLNPWVDYEFRVVAVNGVGVGEPSTPSARIQTKAAGIFSISFSVLLGKCNLTFHSLLPVMLFISVL